MFDKYLILVNKDNKIDNNFIKSFNLVKIVGYKEKEIYVEETTYNNYLKLKKSLEKINLYLTIISGYRSVEDQNNLIEQFKLENKDLTLIADPNHSEHHTGLALDVGFTNVKENILIKEERYRVMHRILHKYGFILRYPKDKDKITGYNSEPWHIRYVGEEVATYIYNNKLSLEEYLNK